LKKVYCSTEPDLGFRVRGSRFRVRRRRQQSERADWFKKWL